MSYIKTSVEIISLQKVAIKTRVSTIIDVSKFSSLDLFYKIGQDGTATTLAGPFSGWSRAELAVEGSLDSAGDGWWFPLADIYPDGAAATQKSLTAALVAGVDKVIADAAAASAFASLNQYIFINDSTNSEWVKVAKETDNTKYDLYQAVMKSHIIGTKYYNKSLVGAINVPVEGVKRVRVTFDNYFFSWINSEGTYKPYWVQVEAITSEEK